MNDREKELQAEELADLARRLEAALQVETPDARREKALFVAGAGARRSAPSWAGVLVPGAAVVVVLVVLALVSRSALPGDTLFPVRKVLGGVGLAPSTAKEVRARLGEAERLVVSASEVVFTSPGRAKDLALEALQVLEEAEDLADELDGPRQEAFEDEIESLEERADAAFDEADDVLKDREREPEDDDSSGPGSGGDDDSSGSGSGSDDDSSGPGSGGDDDDSSGSGSGSDDDSSGSGSGGDDDDSSGSGSGSDDDSSGSGSGGDDDSGGSSGKG